MTYAFIGDPHVGNFSRHGGPKKLGMNRRCELTLKALRDALLTAEEEGAEYAIILGDLFDSMKPEPQLIDAVRQTFRAFAGKMQIILLKGNHDSASDEPRDTALYAVSEPHVIVVDQPRVLSEEDPQRLLGGVRAPQSNWTRCSPPLVLVPFRSGPVIEWLPSVLKELKVRPGSVLCLHAGIKDEQTAPYLRGAPDAIEVTALDALMDEYAIDLVFAGNWHEHLTWEKEGIFQVGALCPTGFSNLGDTLYGHVAILKELIKSSPKRAHVRFRYVPGPRFLKLGPHETPLDAIRSESGADRYYIEWKVPAQNFAAAQAELQQLVADGRIEAGSVLPDTTAATQGVRQAAQAAKHTLGIDEAVAAFVGKLKMPPLADRDSVHARLRKYVGL